MVTLLTSALLLIWLCLVLLFGCLAQANRVEKLYFCAGSIAAHIGGFSVPSILANVYPCAKLLGVDTT